MDITLALQRAVRGYAHGTDALVAALVARGHVLSATSLNHKVNPSYPGAHCSPELAVDIMEVTGDHGAHYASSRRLHYALLPMPEACEGDSQAAQVLGKVIQDFGKLVTEAALDLSDGAVTDNELRRIQAEGAKAQAALHALLALAARMNAEAKPLSFPRVA